MTHSVPHVPLDVMNQLSMPVQPQFEAFALVAVHRRRQWSKHDCAQPCALMSTRKANHVSKGSNDGKDSSDEVEARFKGIFSERIEPTFET